MNTNKVLLKFLSAMLFAALVICLSSSMLNEASADAWSPFGGGNGGNDGLDIIGGGGSGADGGSGSNNYLIMAIAGIVIVVAVLLIIKFVIPKLRAK